MANDQKTHDYWLQLVTEHLWTLELTSFDCVLAELLRGKLCPI